MCDASEKGYFVLDVARILLRDPKMRRRNIQNLEFDEMATTTATTIMNEVTQRN